MLIENFSLLLISESEKLEILSKCLSEFLSAKIFDEKNLFFDDVKLFQNSRGHATSPPRIAIVVEPWLGRFGNNFIQFSNSLKFAKVLGLDSVGLPENEFIMPLSLDDFSNFSTKLGTKDFDYLLVADFWPWPSKTYYQVFGHEYDSSLLPTLRKSVNIVAVDGISPHDLTVFIRSGDVFDDDPNPHYGQPPLGFFKKVIMENHWTKVFIMAEDDSNPTLGGLLDFCDENGINHHLIRRGMRGDFEFLLGSTNLCFGFTSLIPAIAELSTNLLRTFSFETKLWKEGVETVVIIDSIGDYKSSILNSNWSNSSDQLHLMVNYPEENLAYDTLGDLT